jgi:hypothetical protein
MTKRTLSTHRDFRGRVARPAPDKPENVGAGLSGLGQCELLFQAEDDLSGLLRYATCGKALDAARYFLNPRPMRELLEICHPSRYSSMRDWRV